jgi:hypothetical protein
MENLRPPPSFFLRFADSLLTSWSNGMPALFSSASSESVKRNTVMLTTIEENGIPTVYGRIKIGFAHHRLVNYQTLQFLGITTFSRKAYPANPRKRMSQFRLIHSWMIKRNSTKYAQTLVEQHTHSLARDWARSCATALLLALGTQPSSSLAHPWTVHPPSVPPRTYVPAEVYPCYDIKRNRFSPAMVLRDFMDYYGTLDANGLGSQLRRLANLVSFGSNQFKSAHGGVDERENFENVRFGW